MLRVRFLLSRGVPTAVCVCFLFRFRGRTVYVPVPTDSHSRGLFAGLSLEGGVIVPRPDVNRKFYGRQVSVRWAFDVCLLLLCFSVLLFVFVFVFCVLSVWTRMCVRCCGGVWSFCGRQASVRRKCCMWFVVRFCCVHALLLLWRFKNHFW